MSNLRIVLLMGSIVLSLVGIYFLCKAYIADDVALLIVPLIIVIIETPLFLGKSNREVTE